MTIRQIMAIERYIGVSTDTKPTAPPAGSTFYETDSGESYIFDGSTWYAMPDPSGWRIARKTVTFTGAAGAGAVGTVNVFTVTGDVEVARAIGKCTTNLTEAGATATVALGVSGNTGVLIDQVNAVDIDVNEFWGVGGSPARSLNAVVNGVTAMGTGESVAINQDIIITVGAQAVNAGVLGFTTRWRPISTNGLVVPA